MPLLGSETQQWARQKETITDIVKMARRTKLMVGGVRRVTGRGGTRIIVCTWI